MSTSATPTIVHSIDEEKAIDSIPPSVQIDTESDADIQVTLDDDEKPTNMPVQRKWGIVLVICSGALLTTCASSMAGATFEALEKRFDVGFYVAALSISIYILGLGIGPLLLGGLSETFGRSPIYRLSFFFAFLLSFPVAFANHIAILLVFRFLVAFASSAFLSVAGGSLADLFVNEHLALPIALYSVSPFIGPVLGPLIAGFVNQDVYWRWTYHILTIWFGVEFVLIYFFVPETYAPVLTMRKAERMRKETGDKRYFAPLERTGKSIGQIVVESFCKPFQLIAHEPMLLLLNIWTSLILGIVYLTFPIFPIIFGVERGFNQQSVGLTYLGIGAGLILACASQPWWTKHFARRAATYLPLPPPPELRLYQGMLGALLIPLGLVLFAFTVYPSVHWIVPIILITPFGAGTYFAFVSTFTFLIATYRPLAASAVASNSFMRSCFAGAFPLISKPMYERMGNVGATAFLAAIMAICAPLPFLFYRYGPKLRATSKYAWSE